MKISKYKTADDIAVTLHAPQTGENLPAILLCHGFCGIQEILLPAFVKAFVDAGFAAVTFDYRGFGASGGEKGRLVPEMQIADILTVLGTLQDESIIDSQRIGLWGTSFGGCHVMAAAAQAGDRVKAVVSQLGFADGENVVTGAMSPEDKAGFIATLEKMNDKKLATGKEMMVSITKVLSDDESKAFFEENKIQYPAMDIKIPFLTVRETLRYKPADHAAKVTCPVLVMVAEQDKVNPPEQGIDLYHALTTAEKKLYVEQGAKHYDFYSGEHFTPVVAEQTAWFKRWL
ncbi:UilS family quorum-quenching N-acyl-homoserine lactonase [Ewingella americana]|uniref:UilS family quorum-quenching N-acyl-homoserine lactonase n=1 Tax=Ewingella americana TaxID=41202 RepID=UPI00163B220C|nr:alpha/beta fold hydrolase [Ewingella americana]QMV53953.1 alpha/beta hydrolase [Ewingella americana]